MQYKTGYSVRATYSPKEDLAAQEAVAAAHKEREELERDRVSPSCPCPFRPLSPRCRHLIHEMLRKSYNRKAEDEEAAIRVAAAALEAQRRKPIVSTSTLCRTRSHRYMTTELHYGFCRAHQFPPAETNLPALGDATCERAGPAASTR